MQTGYAVGMVDVAALIGLVIWIAEGQSRADDAERAANEYVDPADLYPTGPEISSGEDRYATASSRLALLSLSGSDKPHRVLTRDERLYPLHEQRPPVIRRSVLHGIVSFSASIPSMAASRSG